MAVAMTVNAQSSNSFNITKVFLDKDTTRNCYTLLTPRHTPLKGYLLLLPGFGETAERVLQQSELPIKLATSGILTVIPTLQDGVLSFGIDDASQAALQRIIDHVRNKHVVSKLPFYLGGYSIGGSCVIKYAASVLNKPNAVFAIDPPLDFEQMYYSSERNIRLSIDNDPNGESVFIIQKLKTLMQGTPKEAIGNYYRMSPYSFSDTSQAAVRKLLNVPIRIYTEPDVHWWMKERNMDFTGMNATFHSAIINELNLLGNNKATLVTTQNKGFRQPDHARHPHSWSIVDPEELMDWLKSQ